jgi:hypothetical protein
MEPARLRKAGVRRLGAGEFTVHGFRSAFRDWAAETGVDFGRKFKLGKRLEKSGQKAGADTLCGARRHRGQPIDNLPVV